MHILFITDFFPPETNAAASRVFERASHWVSWGHEVTVITSVPNFPRGEVYPGYRNRWYQTENLGGIHVVRVKTYIAENQGKWRRGLDFLSFLVVALPASLAQRNVDVVAATSPNFFAGLCGCMTSIIKRLPFVLEIGDLWPAFIVGLGEMRRSAVVVALEKVEMFMYRCADRVVCLTEAFRCNLLGRGVPTSKVEVVRNGADLASFFPLARDMDALRRINPANDFLVGYYGTMGAAHGLDIAIEAAAQVQDVRFLFVGEGSEAEVLRQKAEQLQLDNVVFLGPQPRDRMPGLIALCDTALVQLKDTNILGSAIPSKLFEAMALGKPVLLAAPEGEAAEIVKKTGSGIHIRAGDSEALAEGIRTLQRSDRLARIAENSLQASKHFSRESQSRKFLQVCQDVLEANRQASNG